METSIYDYDIEDARVDIRARLFRECEAMLYYAASRAIVLPVGLGDKAAVLDLGIGRRAEISMADLLGLHSMLSEAVQPALPRTIELLQWNSAQPNRWKFLAPVKSIRLLLLLTTGFFLTFWFTLLTPPVNYQSITAGIFAAPTPELSPVQAVQILQIARRRAATAEQEAAQQRQNVEEARAKFENASEAERARAQVAFDLALGNSARANAAALDAQNEMMQAVRELARARSEADEPSFWDRSWIRTLLVMLFFISLAGLGSCFSVLYDARKYVIDGTYDPRIGSNYGIRIALGVVSGVLLAQILTDPGLGDNASGLRVFGLPVLALLGGFGAQLVYTILTKLVAAAESVFDEDRAASLKAREQAVLANVQAQAGQERVDRTVAVVSLAAKLEAASTPEERKAVADQMTRAAAGIREPEVRTGPLPGHALLEQIDASVKLGRKLIDLLPPELRADAAPRLDGVADKLASIRALAEAGRAGDIPGAASVLAKELAGIDPVRAALQGVLGKFSGPLGALGPFGITPAGLALTVAGVTLQQGTKAYARWKTRILDADYTPELLPLANIDAAAVSQALTQVPVFAAAFPGIQGNMAALNALAQRVVNGDDEALRKQHEDKFANPEAFEAALGAFRRALLDPVVKLEMPAPALAEAMVADTTAVLQAADAVRAHPAGRTELERLFLIAATLRDTGTDAERAALIALIKEIAT